MSQIITSNFYFVGTAYGKNMIRDIPIFAFTNGDNFEQEGWESNDVKGKSGFGNIADWIAGSRMLSIVVPQTIASQYFGTKQYYDKLVIDAFNQFNEGNYMVGAPITTVCEKTTVTNMKPIKQWKGLAAPHENQRNHLDKTMERWWAPIAISLFVKDAQASIIN